jgi:antagonist of KipI
MPVVHVMKPGLLSTIQDRGRWGFQALGVSVAGPMDPVSHRIANSLAGNPPDAATIEVTLVGPELVFEDECQIGIAGAEFEISIDDQPASPIGAMLVPKGGTLRLGRRLRGARAYLALAGGIDTPPSFGSRSTHLMSAMGGMDGRALVAGDRLVCGRPAARPVVVRSASALPVRTLPDGCATLRVLPGPQSDRFVPGALDALQSAPYRIAPASDRTGFRLHGPVLQHVHGADIISDATPLGVLQVPASGQPILLMADRQTTGGYPKLATVIAADIGLAGQLGPGDRIDFTVCTPQDALTALIDQERWLMAIEASLR